MPDRAAIEAQQIKQQRRAIIDTLNIVYPDDAAYEVICGAFIEVEEHFIRRDLAYLIDKQYVAWVNPRRHAIWKGRHYKLTAKGTEIAQKIETDPALEPSASRLPEKRPARPTTIAGSDRT